MKYYVMVWFSLLNFTFVSVVTFIHGSSPSEEANAVLKNTTNWAELTETNVPFDFYDYSAENRTPYHGSQVMKIKSRPQEYGMKMTSVTMYESKDRVRHSSNLTWISQPLRDGLVNFRVRAATNLECDKQSNLYQKHLKMNLLWAIRMSESIQSEPVGLIGGSNYQMGNFEECIKTQAYGVKGKYCLANFQYSLSLEDWIRYENMVPDNDFSDMNHEASVWEALVRLKKDPVRISRQNIYWGFCMPASCTPEDLERSLNLTLVPRFHNYSIELNVKVDPIYCHTKDRISFTKGFCITITFMAALLLVNILSTLYDGYEYLKGRYTENIVGWREFFGVFSMWRNIYSLGIYNKNTQVKIANSMKVIMMILIIYGHSLLYILGYPHFNPASLEEVYRRGADIALVNTNIVDVFFAISGFLTFYYGYSPMKIGGMAYLILSIVFRYLRLIPVFAIVIAYVTFILPYTSDGPIWNARIRIESENCYKNWWLDILLLNNFFNVDEQCVLISWYITADILLCILASVLMYTIINKPKIGLFLSLIVLMLSVAITFWVTYVNKYNGLMKLYMTFLENPRKSIEFKELYTALYSRAGPYLVGFLAAYLTVQLQKTNFRFSKKWLFIGCVISVAIGEGSQYYGVVFYQFGRPFSLLENALYSCLHRVLFAVLISWFLLAYLTTGFGILDKIVNFRPLLVLGRLTYSVFLMNTLSLITLTASMRAPIFYSYKMIMFVVFGDIVTTYLLGFLFYIYAEGPVCRISKLLQKRLANLFEEDIEKAKLKVVFKSKKKESIDV